MRYRLLLFLSFCTPTLCGDSGREHQRLSVTTFDLVVTTNPRVDNVLSHVHATWIIVIVIMQDSWEGGGGGNNDSQGSGGGHHLENVWGNDSLRYSF